jgi:hypothetical protein
VPVHVRPLNVTLNLVDKLCHNWVFLLMIDIPCGKIQIVFLHFISFYLVLILSLFSRALLSLYN